MDIQQKVCVSECLPFYCFFPVCQFKVSLECSLFDSELLRIFKLNSTQPLFTVVCYFFNLSFLDLSRLCCNLKLLGSIVVVFVG